MNQRRQGEIWEKALFGLNGVDCVGRGRDDSETSGPRVSGPDGGRDQACGPRARYATYVYGVQPRPGSRRSLQPSSLRHRSPRFLGGEFTHSVMCSFEPQLREHADHVPSERSLHQRKYWY
jgi:hypothetical protein